MKESSIFLTAEWCNLVHFSYYVAPEKLDALKPPNIELDKIGNNAVVSLVIFEFRDTNIKGVPVPAYGNFYEMNLRYNVKDKDGKYRGIVFIKEMVPRSLIAAAANTIYNEKYEVMEITGSKEESLDVLKFNYNIGGEFEITAITEARSTTPPESSVKHLLKQRNAGFGTFDGKTIIYKVEHGIWEIFPLVNYTSNFDFEVFGKQWKFLNDCEPFDVTVAKGSSVNVYDWEYFEY